MIWREAPLQFVPVWITRVDTDKSVTYLSKLLLRCSEKNGSSHIG